MRLHRCRPTAQHGSAHLPLAAWDENGQLPSDEAILYGDVPCRATFVQSQEAQHMTCARTRSLPLVLTMRIVTVAHMERDR